MIRTPRYEGWFIHCTVIYQSAILSEDGRSGTVASCAEGEYNGRKVSNSEWSVTLDQAKHLAENQAKSLDELQLMKGCGDYVIVTRG